MTFRYLSLLIILIGFDILFLYKNPSALSYIFTGLGLMVIVIVIIVSLFLKYDLLPIMLRSFVTLTLVILTCYLLYGRSKTIAKVEFEGIYFGLEYIPDPTLEGYKRTDHIFLITDGSNTRKYIFEHDDGFDFSNFPVDAGILEGVEFSIIDTVNRTIEHYDPTVSLSTLYVDPKRIAQRSWKTFLRFLKAEYQKPENENLILDWLNFNYEGAYNHDPSHFHNTIYAVVCANLDDMEPVYLFEDGKKSLKVRVDHHIDFDDGSTEHPRWRSVGRLKDGVFYCDQDENSKYYGEYISKQGKKFESLYGEMKHSIQ